MKIKKSVFKESLDKLENDYEINVSFRVEMQALPIQTHPYYEMIMLLAGEVAYQTKDGIYVLDPGDIMFFGTYAQHCPIVLNRSLPYERIVLNINPEKLQYLSRDVLDLSECFNLKKRAFSDFHTLSRIIYGFYWENYLASGKACRLEMNCSQIHT